MQQIIMASNNSGKINELKVMLAPHNFEIIPQSKLQIPEIDEPFNTFVENALHKARHASLYSKLPALADDSGICVNQLGGKPGIYSARYAGEPKNDQHNNQKLVADLANIEDKSCYYYCVLVLVRHYLDPQPIIADGILSGTIIAEPRGKNGFGYDPHFYLPQYKKTAAELDITIKNQISHRSMAVNNLLAKLSYFK